MRRALENLPPQVWWCLSGPTSPALDGPPMPGRSFPPPRGAMTSYSVLPPMAGFWLVGARHPRRLPPLFEAGAVVGPPMPSPTTLAGLPRRIKVGYAARAGRRGRTGTPIAG